MYNRLSACPLLCHWSTQKFGGYIFRHLFKIYLRFKDNIICVVMTTRSVFDPVPWCPCNLVRRCRYRFGKWRKSTCLLDEYMLNVFNHQVLNSMHDNKAIIWCIANVTLCRLHNTSFVLRPDLVWPSVSLGSLFTRSVPNGRRCRGH